MQVNWSWSYWKRQDALIALDASIHHGHGHVSQLAEIPNFVWGTSLTSNRGIPFLGKSTGEMLLGNVLEIFFRELFSLEKLNILSEFRVDSPLKHSCTRSTSCGGIEWLMSRRLYCVTCDIWYWRHASRCFGSLDTGSNSYKWKSLTNSTISLLPWLPSPLLITDIT